MDHTQSPDFVNHAGTGQNMHEENQAAPTVWSDKDANSVIWSLMELVKAGGHTGQQFDEDVPATYQVLLKALRAAFGGNITTVNAANTPLVLTADNAGLVIMDATGGNIGATLPAANVLALPVKFTFVRSDATGNTVTISRAGADTFVGGATTFTLSGQGANRSIMSNGGALWAPSGVQLASGAEAAAGTDSVKVLTPATLRNGLNATGSAPLYGCRAFVNWSALGGVVTVRASGNVSSVTRNGLGDFTINFATAMPDANYCPSFAGYWDLTYRCTIVISPAAVPTASALRVETWTHLGGVHDFAYNNVTIHR